MNILVSWLVVGDWWHPVYLDLRLVLPSFQHVVPLVPRDRLKGLSVACLVEVQSLFVPQVSICLAFLDMIKFLLKQPVSLILLVFHPMPQVSEMVLYLGVCDLLSFLNLRYWPPFVVWLVLVLSELRHIDLDCLQHAIVSVVSLIHFLGPCPQLLLRLFTIVDLGFDLKRFIHFRISFLVGCLHELEELIESIFSCPRLHG